jgi:hypothetical protein
MKITFGIHKGKTAEFLMINQPDYIKWILTQHEPSSTFATIQKHITQLIRKFDNKPFKDKSCSSNNCNHSATKFTICESDLNPHWWCNSCEPIHADIPNDQLQSPVGYMSAIKHIDVYCNKQTFAYKSIINMIAEAKGLSANANELKLNMFFR